MPLETETHTHKLIYTHSTAVKDSSICRTSRSRCAGRSTSFLVVFSSRIGMFTSPALVPCTKPIKPLLYSGKSSGHQHAYTFDLADHIVTVSVEQIHLLQVDLRQAKQKVARQAQRERHFRLQNGFCSHTAQHTIRMMTKINCGQGTSN
jgi:hypothetical protein